MPISVPHALVPLLASASVVGVSGSRRPCPASRAALASALALIRPAASVFVGCSRGIDHDARRHLPRARVFRARDFRAQVSHVRAAYARRSAALVKALAAADGGRVLLSFPGAPCPAGLSPSRSASRCFSGSGSGSWASLALARGLGLPAIVFLPAGVAPPAPFGLHAVASGPLGAWWFGPGVAQLALL